MIPSGIKYIENDYHIIDGYKFFVSPITVDMKGWAFAKTDEEAKSIWGKIPDDTNVLITHNPPFGLLDKDSHGNSHGCKHLLERVTQLSQLKAHIFGHVHNIAGNINGDGKRFFNVSVFNNNPPTYIEL